MEIQVSNCILLPIFIPSFVISLTDKSLAALHKLLCSVVIYFLSSVYLKPTLRLKLSFFSLYMVLREDLSSK